MDIPLAEQLQKKIQELEAGDANLKENMSKLILHANNTPGIRFEHQSKVTEESRPDNSSGMGTGVGNCKHSEIGSLNPNNPTGIFSFTNKQYLNILQSMGQALHVVDHYGLIVYWNKAAERIFGYSASEALGQNIKDFIIEGRDLSAANEILERNASGENWTGIFPSRNKQGQVFQVLGTTSPLYDDYGTLVGIICLTIPIESFQETCIQPISLGTKPLNNDSYPSSSWLHNSGLTTTKPCFDPRRKPPKAIISSIITKFANGLCWKRKSPEAATLLDNQMDASRKDVCPWNPFGDTGVYKMINSRVKGISWSWKNQQILQISSGNDRSLSYSTNTKGSSSMGITSSGTCSRSSTCRKIIMETDYLHDISLNNLTFSDQIGRGSCATVYRGLWYGTDVAIKVFSNLDYLDKLLSSFRKEVLLMKSLRHPNVVLFMGAVTSPRHLCIVTEFLPRGSLFGMLRHHTPTLDWERRVQMALDIAQGMNYLHCHNPPIVHRDLKSANLLVDENWTVKVADFGLSRLKNATFLTTSTGKGTTQWMAPEVIRNEPADEKSDVFSFGVVLWELATLKIPWNDLNSMQVIAAVGFMNQRNEIPKDTEPLWASLIESCWHSDSKCRPTFEQVLEKLQVVKARIHGPAQ